MRLCSFFGLKEVVWIERGRITPKHKSVSERVRGRAREGSGGRESLSICLGTMELRQAAAPELEDS